MAAPEEGGTEAPPPPPPAEDEPPGGVTAACGAALGVAAAAAGGAAGPAGPSPSAEGPELLAVTEELAQSLAALEAGAAAGGTVLYLQADGSLVEGAGLSAEEQRRLLEQLLAAAESQGPGPAEPPPPPPRHAATPLAPAELQRVIEQVSKAQEQQKPPPAAAPPEPCRGPPPCRGGGCPPPRDAVPPPPLASIMHNAAQQLQSVAQQVALQQGKAMAAARLLPQKLEAICIQVQPGQMKGTERPMPSLAPIQPKTIALSQSVGRNSSIPGLGIINPQIIRIQPVTGTEQQQLFLHSSSESPVQLLMQKPLPSHGSVSVNKIPAAKMLNGQKTTCAAVSATRSPNITMIAASSANSLMPCLEKNQKDDKLKKSLKVKTRSGRISRPPKYKAKDYKFIKMEDLADGHQSDSDDYSELSIEDDEEGKVKGKDALFSSSSYNLKPKMFKCQTCEKSYIGKGGLARHYKLNPGHGELESSPQKIPLNKPNGSIFVDNVCGIREEMMSPAHLDSIAVTLNNENTLATGLEETVDSKAGEQTCKSAESRYLLAEQQNENSSGHRGPVTPKGPGRPRRPKRRGRPRMGGRSRCSGRLSRPGQSPSKSISSVSAEHNVFRRKARLKELIQQCDNEDLMELALPRLTKLVTVYEFLLMKVEKGHPAKAYFPDVYREFEDLHNMVKKMAYDHLSNSDLLSCQQPVEIKDAKVAESLGIAEILTGEGNMRGVDSCSQCIIKMVSEQVPVEILGQKRLAESSGEELLPSAKRTKLEDVMENVNNYASQDAVKEKSGNLCTLFEKDGFNPLNGEILLSEDRHITCCTTGSTLPTAEEHNSLADSGVRIDAENSGTFSQTVKMRIEYSQPVNIQGLDMAGDAPLLHTEVVLPVEAGGSPELVQAHFVSENTVGELSAPELCRSVSEDAMDSQSTDLPTSEENGHNQKYQKLQEENRNFAIKEHSEQFHNADVTDEMQELEKVFSTNIVPINYPHSAQTELHQNPVQEASLSAHVNHENSFKNMNQFSCGTEEQREVENTVTVDEAVAFEITDESHDFLSQGHEQIFIQTSDGLILSHPDTAVLSQAEGIVIVTDSNGTTMHIRTPEGIPLETVEALLAMETDGQSEDILLSQSELEP
ncbi:zinc finger protein 839 isoform X2 [Falco rusticolus]|uniref:zinc finger protein 839 isoform X2 n=1 Tax=Falco cherrug TaxID=345164 RepID=UPI001886A550|nr:zinc finger protein 839 isoform X2 [Falco cherrug]XP_037250740.1 zinc finger protein 839 isoform X2 [Falco rusticolus]